MQYEQTVKEVVTVAEMGRMCSLSRSRFYGLVREGVMPSPSRNPETGRPFYTKVQQEQCLQVRRTNCGVNGKPILFYSVAVHRQEPLLPKRKTVGMKPKAVRSSAGDLIIDDLLHGLEQLGLADVPRAKLIGILAELHPDGYADAQPAELLATVFRRLSRL